jgi:hypothetical protein
MVDVDAEYNGQQQRFPLFVVMNGGPALFGRQWFYNIKLDWKFSKTPCCNTAYREIAATTGGNEVGV